MGLRWLAGDGRIAMRPYMNGGVEWVYGGWLGYPSPMLLDLHNVRSHLIDQGSGPAILFLHGNPDTGELWRDVISILQDRHRCLAPDLPGFGRSTVTGDFDCSFESMARWVDELVEKTGVETPVDLVLHDFGGPYGLSWAMRHRGKVRRIAIINALCFAEYRWHFWARVWRTPLLGELSMLLMNRWIFNQELRRGSRRLSAEHMAETWGRIHPAMKRMVLELYRATDPDKLAAGEDRMLELTAAKPTRVLWGLRDPYIPARYAERFGTRDVRTFDGCGHWLPAEAPAEVAADLMQFFAR